MRYLSIDVETTGIDPEFNQILSVGIIIEDSTNPLPYEQLPKFHCAIKYDEVYGSLFALNMNKDLIETIVQYSTAKNQDEKNDIVNMTGMQFLHKNEVVKHIMYFLYDNGFVQFPNLDDLSHAAISNSFTRHNGTLYPIIHPNMEKIYLTCAGKNFGTFDKRFLEKLPHWKEVFGIHSRTLDPAILYVDWESDKIIPSMIECKTRAGVPGIVTHNALEDAWDVVQLLRKKYGTFNN
jgi:oligoribonuclease